MNPVGLFYFKQSAVLYIGHGEMIEDSVEAMKQAVKTAYSKLRDKGTG